MYTKFVPETVHYISFTSKCIWNHLYLFIICIIYLESSTKVFFTNLNITLNYWFISKPINIRSKYPWVPGILSFSLTYCFSFLSVIATLEVYSCIFVLKCYSSIALIPWYPFPFCSVIILSHIIKWKSWSDE